MLTYRVLLGARNPMVCPIRGVQDSDGGGGGFAGLNKLLNHGSSIKSVGVEIAREFDEILLNRWLATLLKTRGSELYRLKVSLTWACLQND